MRKPSKKNDSFEKRLSDACRGLVYISETDSPVEPFFGAEVAGITKGSVLAVIGKPSSTKHVEITFDKFFDRLTAKKDWHSKIERKNADGFEKLRALLEVELKDIAVYKCGNIQIEIIVVGLDKSGWLAGVKMDAVET